MLSSGDRLGKLFKFIFILLVLLIIAAAVTPLNLYYDQVKQQLRPVTLSGIGGSAVKGSADSLTYMSVPMGQAEWLLYPNSLNGLGGKVRVYKSNYDLTFDLKKISDDNQMFNKVTGFIDWDMIKPFLQLRYGQLDGYAQLNLHDVKYNKSQGISHMAGDITLRDFKLLKPTSKDLGTVTVEFKTQKEGVVVGQFSSESTMLNVSGALYLQPHRWQLSLDIIPKAGNFEMDAALSTVGDPRRGGGRKLKLAGFY